MTAVVRALGRDVPLTYWRHKRPQGERKYSIGFPCSLYPGIRYPMPSTASGTALLIAARTCSSFGRTASGCVAMYSSIDLGTLCFIPSFYVSTCGFSSPISVWPSTPSGDPFHTGSVLLCIELFRMERCLGPGREVALQSVAGPTSHCSRGGRCYPYR